MVADLKGRRDHGIVRRALTALLRLEHRGARGAEVNTGDGAGILLQIPDAFFRAVVDVRAARRKAPTPRASPSCPPSGADEATAEIDALAAEEGLRRARAGASCPPTPTAPTSAPPRAASCPRFRQLFVAGAAGETGLDLERRTFCLRKRAEHATDVYFPSLSPRTIVYKGMLAEPQVEPFYPDLSDERVVSALALVHSRFSTNTFPAWPLAHPYRYVAHNGEINTLRGNRNWMAAREALLRVRPDPGRPRAPLPDRHPGRERLRHVRRGARAAAPRRPLAAARGADDDPGGVGEPRRDGSRPPRLLRVPLHAHGAVGRARARRVHRRHRRRRRARPQRPAPRPLLGHRGRARRAGVRGRRAGRRAVDGRAQGPPRARPHVPGRHGRGQHRRRRGDQGRAGRRAPLRGVAARRPDPPRRPARRASARCPRHAALTLRQQSHRLHRGGAGRPAQADGRHRGGADRLDGQRRAARRHLGAAPAAVRLLQPAVRAGHEPAAGRDPRGAGHLARQPARPGAEPARRRGRALPHDHPARAGAHQRRPRQDRRTSTTTATTPASPPSPCAARSARPTAAPGLQERLDADLHRRCRRPSRTAPG